MSWEIGTAMSCLTDPPACFSPSGIVSRTAQKARRCVSDWASTASVTQPASMSCSRQPISTSSRGMRAEDAVSSRRTAPPGPAFNPVPAPRISATRAREEAEISSKVEARSDVSRLTNAAISGMGAPTPSSSHAVARCPCAGQSLSTTPVMMPSVPSAPMKSCLRS